MTEIKEEKEKKKNGFPSIIVRGDGELKVGQTEDYRRSSHNDFKTSAELKASEFSGVRCNSISSHVEIWILGEVRFSMHKDRMAQNPSEFDESYKNLFGLI